MFRGDRAASRKANKIAVSKCRARLLTHLLVYSCLLFAFASFRSSHALRLSGLRAVALPRALALHRFSSYPQGRQHEPNGALGDGHAASYLSGKQVAIIGAAGYVGSALHAFLEGRGVTVTGFDRDPRGLAHRVVANASHAIPTNNLRSFDAVVYLGGLTGRVACDKHPDDVQHENIDDIVHLARRMRASQTLIFASTSAVAEGSADRPQRESDAIRFELLDRYSDSLARREDALRRLAEGHGGSGDRVRLPQMVGLRFGTVVGTSPSQRLDLVHMAMVCNAFLRGRVRVTHAESHRAVLSMRDLERAIYRVIVAPHRAARFDVFHLTSFNTHVSAVATAVAARTGATLEYVENQPPGDIVGFSLDASRFSEAFDFTFRGSQDSVIDDLTKDVPTTCTGRELTHRTANDSMPCAVCKSHDMLTVLDLGEQSLANDFSEDPAVAESRERYPLKLVRCRRCHHAQLSHLVSRERVFSNYNYQSGTSRTLAKYFEFIVDKVAEETGKKVAGGTVLELACNDGTQLDKFAARGWKTHGVDPAANLVKLAQEKGHHAQVGFWGQEPVGNLPPPDELDAIVGQNVLAHVGHPVDFLAACARAMGPRTLLYVQTSQCEMFQTGQFDTVYHEHVSFFSAHSFKRAAELAGLEIVNFEITPIHGRSCLVTMKKSSGSDARHTVAASAGVDKKGPESTLASASLTDQSQALQAFLKAEHDQGMLGDWFYLQYRARAHALRDWIHRQLINLHDQGFDIVCYGAAAKGMVLLQFLQSLPGAKDAYEWQYVVDDAPMKQGTFCPGTRVPVKPTSALAAHPGSKPLVVVIFAWNFEEEILFNIREQLKGSDRRVLAIVPFPQQRIINVMDGATVSAASSDSETKGSSAAPPVAPPLLVNPMEPVFWPLRPQTKCPVVAIMHFYNEEFLLPYWIRHHAPMFDKVVLIDYHSTDRSAEVVRKEAPSSWEVVRSRNQDFNAVECDREVVHYESTLPRCSWTIALTTTEFLVHPNLRGMLADVSASPQTAATKVLRFPAFIMVGNDTIPLKRDAQLLDQRSMYGLDPALNLEAETGVNEGYSRFMHRSEIEYSPGRHRINLPFEWAGSGFIAKYQWTPWPEIMERKAQIKEKIPQVDIDGGLGVHHLAGREAFIEQQKGVHASTLQGNFRVRRVAAAMKEAQASDPRPASVQETAASRDWYKTMQGNVRFVWE
jgi:nucleoside-diphosphate-sugar epimerase